MGLFIYSSSKKGSWRLLEKTYRDGKTLRKTIPKMAFRELGFREDMSIDEARSRAKQLNQQSNIDRRKEVEAARRVEHLKLVDSAYLPKLWVSKFENELNDLTFGKDDRIDTIMKNWRTVQRIIVELEIDPKDFYESRFKIYKIFIKRQYSPDYSSRMVRLFNLWGHFMSRQTNTYFQPIPTLKPIERQKLVEAREEKTGVRREADPLTQEMLNKYKSTFEDINLKTQWNWLYLASWFGLRPSEVDGLHDKKNYVIEFDKKNKVKVLMVYQTKLTSLPKDKRWKPIPIFFKEQEAAIEIMLSGEFKRPLAKTLKRHVGDNIDNYSPRKAFTDLMLSKGLDLEDVAVFLGHRSIETTWKHYKDKFTFKMPKAG